MANVQFYFQRISQKNQFISAIIATIIATNEVIVENIPINKDCSFIFSTSNFITRNILANKNIKIANNIINLLPPLTIK